MTTDTSALHYLSAADAARDLDPDNYWPAYQVIYALLTSGEIEGAYLAGRRWIIPVDGLRAAGIEISGEGAVEIEPVRPRTSRPEPETEIVPEPEVDDAPPIPRSAVAARILREAEDEFASLHHLLASKNLEIARLRVERDAALDRAAAAEEHLRDLRSILDQATSPDQK